MMISATRTNKAAARVVRLSHTQADTPVKVENGNPIRVRGIYISGGSVTDGITVRIQDNDSNDIIVVSPLFGVSFQGAIVTIEIDIPFIASNGIQSVCSSADVYFTTVIYDNTGL